jgi:regulator of PEP synthase PpsR (kinase-PPPase family)
MTAERVIKAVLLQFNSANIEINRIPNVRNKVRIVEAVELASKAKGIIVHTLVSNELRNILHSKCTEYEVMTLDLLGPVLTMLTDFLETPPIATPALQHKLSDGYFREIECIEYTINHDDGRDPDGLSQADIVIVGVSRTSKTPLSIFLSNQYALNVANVPIILGLDLPRQLFRLDNNRIIGLTISPRRLMEIRKARIQRMKGEAPSGYADYDQILEELKYSYQIFALKAWTIIDVTEKSIEEIATEIIDLIYLKRYRDSTFQ